MGAVGHSSDPCHLGEDGLVDDNPEVDSLGVDGARVSDPEADHFSCSATDSSALPGIEAAYHFL